MDLVTRLCERKAAVVQFVRGQADGSLYREEDQRALCASGQN